jgi:hypothetical protein
MIYKFDSGQHVHAMVDDDGNVRPLTGTTSVLDVLAKPLTWWASGLACQEMGWHPNKVDGKFINKTERLAHTSKEFEKIKALTPEEYFAKLDTAYAAHNNVKNKAAVGGTSLHNKCEEWIKGQIDGTNTPPDKQILPLVKWANMNVEKFLWSEVNCFSTEHWLGGISDIGFLDKEGRVGILDIKSSKDAYASQFIQCAGYDIQISENGGYTPTGEKVFDLDGKKIDYYAILPFGMAEPEVIERHDTQQLKEAFLACLKLYRILNN